MLNNTDFLLDSAAAFGRMSFMKRILVFAALAAAFCADVFAHTASVVFKLPNGDVAVTKELAENSDGTFRFVLPKGEVPAGALSADVKFDFANAIKGDDGYFIMADGRLGYFKLDKGILEEKRNPMPIFGMKKADTAFVAIVKTFKYDFATVVEASGGVYQVFPRFDFTEMLGGKPDKDLVIDVEFFKGKKAHYSSMARAYRKYQLGRGEVVPLKERVKNRPELAYAAESVYVRFLMAQKPRNQKGFEHQTLEHEPPLRVFLTFDDVSKKIDEFYAAGIKKLDFCLVGWNDGGMDGRFPTLFPPEQKLGGESAMKETVANAQQKGYQIVAHVCNDDFYTISKRFNLSDIATDKNGKPTTGRQIQSGGIAYKPCYKQVFEKYVAADLDGLKDLGIRGLHHIDVTSCITPRPCFNPAHPCSRDDTAEYMNKIGLLAREKIGGFASEGPCDQVANSLDYALYVSAYPLYLGKKRPMMDKIVPLWQIAYHGIILSNPFYSTLDPFIIDSGRAEKCKVHGDVRERWLKIVEFGGRPCFYMREYNDISPVKTAAEEYAKVSHLQYEFINFHGEIAPNVFITKYSDGSATVCNYTDKPFDYKGKTVEPLDYIIVKKQKKQK